MLHINLAPGKTRHKSAPAKQSLEVKDILSYNGHRNPAPFKLNPFRPFARMSWGGYPLHDELLPVSTSLVSTYRSVSKVGASTEEEVSARNNFLQAIASRLDRVEKLRFTRGVSSNVPPGGLRTLASNLDMSSTVSSGEYGLGQLHSHFDDVSADIRNLSVTATNHPFFRKIGAVAAHYAVYAVIGIILKLAGVAVPYVGNGWPANKLFNHDKPAAVSTTTPGATHGTTSGSSGNKSSGTSGAAPGNPALKAQIGPVPAFEDWSKKFLTPARVKDAVKLFENGMNILGQRYSAFGQLKSQVTKFFEDYLTQTPNLTEADARTIGNNIASAINNYMKNSGADVARILPGLETQKTTGGFLNPFTL